MRGLSSSPVRFTSNLNVTLVPLALTCERDQGDKKTSVVQLLAPNQVRACLLNGVQAEPAVAHG